MPEIKIKGLVYVKRGRVGTRSEGPDYFLQSAKRDYGLTFHERHLWEPDFELEYYSGRIVNVTGEDSGHDSIKVAHITLSHDPSIKD